MYETKHILLQVTYLILFFVMGYLLNNYFLKVLK